VRPGYKKTEVGVIPEDWETVAVADLVAPSAPICYGVVQVGPHTESGVPIVAIKFVKEIDHAPLHQTSIKLEQPYARSRPRGGDILISIKGTIGRVGIVPSGFRGNISRELARLRIKEDSYSEFIAHQLEAGATQERVMRSVVGTTRLEFSIATLRKFPLPIPPTKAEQRAIAEALNDVDALLAALDRIIAKKRDLKQAAMQQLLTGKARLPGFSGEWAQKRVEDFAACTAGGTPATTVPAYWGGGIRWMNSGELNLKRVSEVEGRITEFGLANSSAKVLPKRCVLIGLAGQGKTRGTVAINEIELATNQSIAGILPNDSFEPEYLYHNLNARYDELRDLSSGGGGRGGLNLRIIKNLEVPFPHSNEQRTIASVLKEIDEEISALEKRLAKTRNLKQAMTQELLTGRTRLVAPGVSAEEKISVSPSTRQANIHFIRSVLAAEIIDRLHDQPTFGHVKFEKMLFLVERLCDVDTGSTYYRQAAGPYDNRALRSIDSQLRKQQWFDARKEGQRYQYVPMKNRGGHKRYFDRYFSGIADSFENILGTFRTQNTERCEIVATLFSAWSDLLQESKLVSDDKIVNEVLNNWHESKQLISEERWRKALAWMRSENFVPKKAATSPATSKKP
jgi:restriction endonuclease S subunit